MSNGERWIDIPDFPDYEISDHGKVFSKKNNQPLALSRNTRGHTKVNFSFEGEVHTRSVRVLVAQAFLKQPTDIESQTFDLDVINLDGNPENNHWANLAWRPHWFAWKYANQFNKPTPQEYSVDIINTLTGDVFENVMDAGITYGELWEYIYNSAISGRSVYPSGAVYEFLAPGTVSQVLQGL